MPSHQNTLPGRLGNSCCTAADRIAPPETDRDRVQGYQNDPLGFFRDVLGLTFWSRQAEIPVALLTWKRISVASGHKIGKSAALAAIAIWFYCSRRAGGDHGGNRSAGQRDHLARREALRPQFANPDSGRREHASDR
jgi:hypothetical protein